MKVTARFVTLSLICLLVSSAAATAPRITIITVGPDGDHLTIQGAVDTLSDAVIASLRIQASTYLENVLLPSSLDNAMISMSGGWDTTFLVQTDDPSLTVIDAGLTARALDIRMSGGSLTVQNMTLQNGFSFSGAGALVDPTGENNITFEDCRIINNQSDPAYASFGTGIYVYLYGSSSLTIDSCLFSGNQGTTTSGNEAIGGGLYLDIKDNVSALVQKSVFTNNGVTSNGEAAAGGTSMSLKDNSQVQVLDNEFSSNSAHAQTGLGVTAAMFRATGSSQLTIRRNLFLNNNMSGVPGFQVSISSEIMATILASDSVIAGGNSHGLSMIAHDTAAARVSNFTIADNAEDGAVLNGTGAPLSLYNTISYGNGTDFVSTGTVDVGSNLIGVDPLFFAPADDYRLLPGSPAYDAGNDTPPGGLGPSDADGYPRQHGTVDIGAYECTAIFVDGFESGNTSAWSTAVP